MSLLIKVDKVSRVKIGDDWHDVGRIENDGKLESSFMLDAYEYVTTAWFRTNNACEVLYGGQDPAICNTGFSFIESPSGKRIAGPLTSITAVVEDDAVSNY